MKVFISICLTLFMSISYAKSIETKENTRALAQTMMGHFVKKEFAEGIGVAKLHWPLPEVELDNLTNNINKQWPAIEKRFGKAVGQELVKTERIGDSFIRYFFLHKFNNHAIYWKVTFYKPQDIWKVNGVSFSDKLNTLYD